MDPHPNTPPAAPRVPTAPAGEEESLFPLGAGGGKPEGKTSLEHNFVCFSIQAKQCCALFGAALRFIEEPIVVHVNSFLHFK